MGLFILFIVALVISYVIATEFSTIAQQKGYDERKYFWFCFLFGIAGYLMVVALPKKEKKNNDENEGFYFQKRSLDMKKTENDLDENISSEDEIVGFETASENTIICSLCNFEQPVGRKVCWKCGHKFFEE